MVLSPYDAELDRGKRYFDERLHALSPTLKLPLRSLGPVSARGDDHTTNQNIEIKELFLRDGILRQMTHIQVREGNLA